MRTSIAFAPGTVDAVSDALGTARTSGLTVAPCGGGTKLRWAGLENVTPLPMGAVAGAVDHCAGDLTATLPAGMSLEAVNSVLRRGGQWLPLDPAHAEAATIGGVIAANDSGPRRHRYGSPRDLLIGIEMVLADGRLAKAGGRVVKNVAGYDLGRLLCGSFGSLAVITAATFKLAPLAETSRTVVARVNGPRELDAIGRTLTASPLTPSAVELAGPPLRLYIRFESTAAAADRQASATAGICRQHHGDAAIVGGLEESAAWREADAQVWRSPGTLLKISVVPTMVPSVISELTREAQARGIGWQACGRALLGVLYVRIQGGADASAAVAARLRGLAESQGGSLMILEAERGVLQRIPRFGAMGPSLAVMRAVKARFDPHGVLPPIPAGDR
jgi:glycolate oxidase FAD binding subunit